MAAFVDDELDLGELGKFKCSFLEEAMKLYPCPVESNYVGRLENYDRRIKEHGAYKLGLFISLKRLHEKIEDMNRLIANREKLISDFSKYFVAFPKRQGQIHYRQKK